MNSQLRNCSPQNGAEKPLLKPSLTQSTPPPAPVVPPLKDNQHHSLLTQSENDDVQKPNQQNKELLSSDDIGKDSSAPLINKASNENPTTRTTEEEMGYKLVPPDGGWGWLVMFGATLVNVLIPGTIKSFGVLLVEFLKAFNASPSSGMWIPALCYFLYSSLGPISSILSIKYSYRTVTFVGGGFAAGGMILSFWSNSLPYLYVTYGICVGIGAGLAFPPTVYIVTSYFVKLRGLANGICISGSAFGSILLPPFLRYLLENFGYKGAVLIMGAVTLNVFVAALFYDPVEKHLKKVKVDDDVEEEDVPTKDTTDTQHRAKFLMIQDSMNSLPQMSHNNSFIEPNDINNVKFNRSASSAAVPNIILSPRKERKISMPAGKYEMKVDSSFNVNNAPLDAVPEKQNGNNSNNMPTNMQFPKRSLRSGTPKRSPSTSSFQYISTPYHGSTLTLQPEVFASSFSLRSKPQSNNNNSITKSQQPPKKVKLFDISLLKDPLYLIILISNATNAISYTNFIILLPLYADHLNFDQDSGALLLSIVSTLDLVGRIGGSALSDLTKFPKSLYFCGGLFISGLTLAMIPLFYNYWVIAGICCVFGLASGTYVGITAIVMSDLLGDERLQSTYGISLFVNGIVQLIGPPICGYWFEITNSYVSLFFTLGLILIAGSLLWSFVPCLLKNNKKEIDNIA